MIIKMNKYSFLIFHKEYSDFLVRLRDLGVVHIRQNNDTKQVEEIKALLAEQKQMRQTIDRMTSIWSIAGLTPEELKPANEYLHISADSFSTASKYIETIATIDAEIEANLKKVNELNQLKSELRVWGDFDPQLLRRLAEAGQEIRFWTIPLPQYKTEWEEQYGAIIISDARRIASFVTVTPTGVVPKISAERVDLPMRSLSDIEREVEEISAETERLRESLVYLSHDKSVLERHLSELEDVYNMSNALLQGEAMFDDSLIVLEGYIPAEQSEGLEKALDAEGYAYAQLEIKDTENVPIKLKNNFFVGVFEPIVKLFSLPNYHEVDPTPFVAPFFMLFFAMCFGDAGYGLFLLILCSFFKIKAKENLKPVLSLFQWLGGAAAVIGFFSGSFFGIELAKVEALASIRKFFISSDNMMIIAIAVGLVQIIVAKFVGAYKVKIQKGTRHALSPFAWVIFIIVMLAIVLFGLPQVDIQLPAYSNYILYGIAGLCAVVMVFFNSPGKGILFNIGSSIWTAYNTASGLLGDSLSYIRLFAIGLTGAILGSVFNTLAISMTDGIPIYVRWLPMLIILLLGHAINFGLAMIGSLVHPVRLIFVEYFNNSDYEGGGQAYSPLKKNSLSQD